MSATPGTCRHCGCTENNACPLSNGDACCWIDRERICCSRPSCIKAETLRRDRLKAAAQASRPRKLRSWEVHQQILEESRTRRKAARERQRKKGRAA